jgi:hypothetical protein
MGGLGRHVLGRLIAGRARAALGRRRPLLLARRGSRAGAAFVAGEKVSDGSSGYLSRARGLVFAGRVFAGRSRLFTGALVRDRRLLLGGRSRSRLLTAALARNRSVRRGGLAAARTIALGRFRRRLLRTRRQQRQRIDVPLRLGGDADTEMNALDKVAARFRDRSHGLAFADARALGDRERGETDQRYGIAVAGANSHRAPASRDGARERHRAGRRRQHVRADLSRDIDAAVLPAQIGIVSEREAPHDRAAGGPGPASGRNRCDQRDQDEPKRDCCRAPHRNSFRCLFCIRSRQHNETLRRCQS